MSEKKLNARIVHKHDVEANWLKATNFIPKQGEIIVYDKDASHNYGRIKVGDGETTVSSLPFTTATVLSDAKLYIDEQIESLMDGDFAISNAEYAETAGHATTADSATTATSAESANTANSAGHATTADSATNADTIDGKHAYDFASNEDLSALQNLVGDDSVAAQIESALGTISQSDWKQTDEAASDYIKNKTHWEEETEVVLVDGFTLEEYINEDTENPKCTFIVGDNYKVIWNGIEYNCTCFEDSGWRVLGTPDNYPFYIDDDGGDALYISPDNSDETWTVSIVHFKQEVHQIDPKYIPDSVKTHDWNTLENRPFGEEIVVSEYVVQDTIYNFSETDYVNGVYRADVRFSNMIGGAIYIVTIDKVSYCCTCVGNNDYTRILGNASLLDTTHSNGIHFTSGWDGISDFELVDTGEPFVLYYHSYNFTQYGMVYTVGGDHEISIGVGEIDITPLDAKYLPELGSKIGQPGTGKDAEIFNDYKNNVASGEYSHAEGSWTKASGQYSHAEGNNTTARSMSQHVQGEYNIVDAEGSAGSRGKYAHIVGNGTSLMDRSNAHTLDWGGNAWFHGEIKVGGTSQDDEDAKTLATVESVTALVGDTPVASQISDAVSTKANASDVVDLQNIIYQDASGDINVDRTFSDYMDSKVKITGRDIIFTDYAMDEYPIISTLNSKSDTGHTHRTTSIEGVLPVRKGGTGHDLSTYADNTVLLKQSNSEGTPFIDAYTHLPAEVGGTGTDLSKFADDSILVKKTNQEGRPYVDICTSLTLGGNLITGTLPTAKGGTGYNIGEYPDNVILMKRTSDNGSPYMGYYSSLSLSGDYITGTLPLGKGGTGSTTGLADAPDNAMIRKAAGENYLYYTATGNGAFYATSTNGAPKFGTLPVAQGGTGSTSSKTSVTINRGSQVGTASSAYGYDCKYIPYLNMCFVRIYVQPKSTWSADTEYEVATVSSSTYYPENMIALSVYAQKEVSAYVNTEGKVMVRPYESVGTDYGIRLAGFWFCN